MTLRETFIIEALSEFNRENYGKTGTYDVNAAVLEYLKRQIIENERVVHKAASMFLGKYGNLFKVAFNYPGETVQKVLDECAEFQQDMIIQEIWMKNQIGVIENLLKAPEYEHPKGIYSKLVTYRDMLVAYLPNRAPVTIKYEPILLQDAIDWMSINYKNKPWDQLNEGEQSYVQEMVRRSGEFLKNN